MTQRFAGRLSRFAAALGLGLTINSSADARSPAKHSVQAAAPVPAPVLAIAGHTPAEVESLLGKPIDVSTVRPSNTPCPCQKALYAGDVEVVYIDGVADWITFNRVDGLTMSPSSLSALGLHVSVPTVSIPQTLRWHDLDGLLEVHLNADPGAAGDFEKVGWIYIKSLTP